MILGTICLATFALFVVAAADDFISLQQYSFQQGYCSDYDFTESSLFSLSNLKRAGFSVKDILSDKTVSKYCNPNATIWSTWFSQLSLCKADQFREAGFNTSELHDGGFTAKILKVNSHIIS